LSSFLTTSLVPAPSDTNPTTLRFYGQLATAIADVAEQHLLPHNCPLITGELQKQSTTKRRNSTVAGDPVQSASLELR